MGRVLLINPKDGPAPPKARKEDVDYGRAKESSLERCGNCASFLPARGECRKVMGPILARMWCKLWTRRR